ncbi:MAG: hypothetical protein LR011_08415 [Verrucomicrobia bacterium]|nr:hypothetical protein [Verrucomicrobiota bacterium]
MVMDNPLAELTGNWVESNHTPGFVGKNYLHDNRAQDRVLAARFQFPQLKAGVWHALMSFTPGENRASAVPVVIGLADREYAFTVNQKQPGNLSPGLISLGEITLPDDGDVSIVISNEHAKDGHVIVDAVALTQRNPATWTPSSGRSPGGGSSE